MRISDWSSDVCSSDLALLQLVRRGALHQQQRAQRPVPQAASQRAERPASRAELCLRMQLRQGVGAGERAGARDRQSVVSGKSVSVRVDPGGRRLIQKKKQNKQSTQRTNILHTQ